MSRKLYFECSSGISGDMSVAAMLDLGADEKAVRRAVESMGLDGYKISRVSKNGIDACDFEVITKNNAYDHDMEYLHGHHHEHSHDDLPQHEHTHDHAYEYHHEHRGLIEITDIINKAALTDSAKALAIKIFHIIARAEAKAHNTDIDKVHFHEVGAVDSIIDIVAFAACMDSLGIDEVIIPKLCDGSGFIRCQHGVIPVPVPAVMNIAEENGLNISITDIEGELVTPTGAAIAAAVRTGDTLPDSFKIIKTGLGAGKREYKVPSLLRIFIIEDEDTEDIWKLETNIDDSSGEALGYTMESLMKNGALDAYFVPIYMKKGRPAYLLSVICSKSDIKNMENIIFKNTTTIGIRRFKCERTRVERSTEKLNTTFGEVIVKKCIIDGTERVYPEYESVKKICEDNDISYTDAYRIICGECNNI